MLRNARLAIYIYNIFAACDSWAYYTNTKEQMVGIDQSRSIITVDYDWSISIPIACTFVLCDGPYPYAEIQAAFAHYTMSKIVIQFWTSVLCGFLWTLKASFCLWLEMTSDKNNSDRLFGDKLQEWIATKTEEKLENGKEYALENTFTYISTKNPASKSDWIPVNFLAGIPTTNWTLRNRI